MQSRVVALKENEFTLPAVEAQICRTRQGVPGSQTGKYFEVISVRLKFVNLPHSYLNCPGAEGHTLRNSKEVNADI